MPIYTVVDVRLTDGTDSSANVTQFLYNTVTQGRETSNHADDQNGGHEHEFRRDDKTGVIAQETSQQILHFASPFLENALVHASEPIKGIGNLRAYFGYPMR